MIKKAYRPLIAIAISALLIGAPGCSMMQRNPKPTSNSVGTGQMTPIGHLTTNRTGDNERALRMGRDLLREKNLDDKYDIETATAYNRGDHWEVCFTPKKGLAKRMRKRCFVFGL